MKIWKAIFGGIVIIGVFGVVGFLKFQAGADLVNPPQFIQADFIDLDKIYSISKFRSGAGHDFSGNGEKCRSMKHYFNVQDSSEKFAVWDKNNGLPPPPVAGSAIDIFSPVDGKIVKVEVEQTPIGQQVYISPEKASEFTVRLFHIYLLPEIKKGSQVKAGQKIGEIGKYQNTDIAISTGLIGRTFISYFQALPENIFVKYQARGVVSRNELIITKEQRDAQPLQCNGEQFAKKYDSIAPEANYVYLSGWQNPVSY
ncbi:hypothetical protein HYW32_00380 [Candidatus Berkelbacteria bacterium]|nr:hypothetical protein [Candidatus Berkelbacteria bacterium]